MAPAGKPTSNPPPEPPPGDGRDARAADLPAHSGRRPRFELRPAEESINPYAQRLGEYPRHALDSEAVRAARGGWRGLLRPEDPEAARAPLLLEIGPGNGFFLAALAAGRPEAALIGLEIRYKRVWLCARKLAAAGITNARAGHFHGGYLREVFEPGEVSEVFINHPDPWPKKRHHVNRLVNPDFCRILTHLLIPGGRVTLKSDYFPYLPVMREAFTSTGYREVAFSPDLHAESGALAESNIVTNYESKFQRRGEPVFLLSFLAPVS